MSRYAKSLSVYINQPKMAVPIQQSDFFGIPILMAYEAAYSSLDDAWPSARSMRANIQWSWSWKPGECGVLRHGEARPCGVMVVFFQSKGIRDPLSLDLDA